MPSKPFEQWLSAELVPRWLRAPEDARLLRAIGLLKDRLKSEAKQAVRAGFVANCPDDALAWHGPARLMERYPGESVDQYRARLLAAWDTWEFAGTHGAVARALNAAGFTNTFIYDVNNNPPPSDLWDHDTANWSRFWVELYPPFGPWDWQRITWGTGWWGPPQPNQPPITPPPPGYGSGYTWGSTATPEQVAFVRRVIRKWKSAHTVCAGIIVHLYTNGVDATGGYTTLLWKGM